MCYSQGNISYVGPEQGLSNRRVTDIYQDRSGFMWLGTFDGLNRYDGYGMKVYRSRLNDSTALPTNRVKTVCGDKYNNIWVGTDDGVSIYNPLTKKFTGITYRSSKNGKSTKSTASVNLIEINKQGDVFIGFDDLGLWVCRSGKREAEQISLEGLNEEKIDESQILSLTIDQKDQVWFFAEGVGLCKYNGKSNTASVVNQTHKKGRFLRSGPDGDLWFGGEKGLFVFHVNTGIVSEQLNRFIATDIFFDENGDKWLATDGNGLFLQRSGEDKFLPFDGLEKNKMQNLAFSRFYKDSQERLWIGTIREGATIINMKTPFFRIINYKKQPQTDKSSDFIAALWEDRNADIWIGRDGGGLSRWNPAKKTTLNWLKEPGKPGNLPSDYVTNVMTDESGKVWITTWGGGVSQYDAESDSFRKFVCYNPVTKKNDIFAWTLYEDKQNNIWVGMHEGALYRLDKIKNEFRLFDAGLISIVSLYEDSNRELWGGNYKSLIRIDRKTKKNIRYSIGLPTRTIHEDKHHRFWIGTDGGGLLLFNRQTGKFIRYTEDDGLCNNFILSMLEDGDGNLWIGTLNGLSRFTPETKRFTNFSEVDGLQSSQFNYHSAIGLRSGEFVFGGVRGLNIFDPLMNFQRHVIAELQLTGVSVDNTPIEENPDFIKKRSGNRITELQIPNSKAALSFEFVVPEYNAPGRIRYAYYLKGLDEKWSAAGNTRSANYPRLNEGDYVFKVRATDINGVWRKDEIQIKVTVLPPWYRTWWAYFFFATATIAAFYAYIRQQNERVRLKYERELFQVKVDEERRQAQYLISLTEMEAGREREKLRYRVQLADMEAEKEREINEKKLSFFTNISHEIRTHLTLITGPVEWLLSTKKEDQQVQDQLRVAKSNSDRLLKLVNELMDFRKMESSQTTLQISQNDVVSFLKGILGSFRHFTESKGIHPAFFASNNSIMLWYDQDQLQKVIFNLLMNAYKFTPDGGSISISVEEKEEQVEIKISDNGKGIAPENLDKLFTNYFQVEDSGTPNTGYGIGLALSKGIVELHKGALSVTSSLARNGSNGWTIFTITLLRGEKHFESDQISDNNLVGTTAESSPVSNVPVNRVTTEGKQKRQYTILFVEDNDELRTWGRDALIGQYHIIEARNGLEGWKLAVEHIPDLVISDVMMAEMDGLELCRKIKSDMRTSHVPVILLTAKTAVPHQLEGLESGADLYVLKPFSIQILELNIRNLFHAREIMQQKYSRQLVLGERMIEVNNREEEFLSKIVRFVEENMEDKSIGVMELASHVGMSKSALYKKLRAVTDMTINDFIKMIRLRRAARLLQEGHLTVNEVAYKVGYDDRKYFGGEFKKQFGKTPSDYALGK